MRWINDPEEWVNNPKHLGCVTAALVQMYTLYKYEIYYQQNEYKMQMATLRQPQGIKQRVAVTIDPNR